MRDPSGLGDLARQALLVHPAVGQIPHLDAEFLRPLFGAVPDPSRQGIHPTGEVFEQDPRVVHECPQTSRCRQPPQCPTKTNPVQSPDCPHDLVPVQFHQLHSSILSLVSNTYRDATIPAPGHGSLSRLVAAERSEAALCTSWSRFPASRCLTGIGSPRRIWPIEQTGVSTETAGRTYD